MTALQKLEEIQRRTLVRHPRSILEKLQRSEEQFDSNSKSVMSLRDLCTQYESWMEEMPTPYQEPIFYKLLSNSFNRLQNLIDKGEITFHEEKLEIKPIPIYGSIHADIYNAVVMIVNNTPLIIFCEGLFEIANMFATVISSKICVDIKHTSYGPREEEVTRYFIDSLISYLMFGTTVGAKPLEFNDKNEDVIHSQILGTYLLFISSHEYAHLLLNHLKTLDKVSISLCGSNEIACQYSWQQEFDADELAVRLVTKDELTTYDMCTCGILLFFKTLSIIEMRDRPDYISHPPSDVRKEHIYQILADGTKQNLTLMVPDVILETKLRQYLAFIDFLDEHEVELERANYYQIQNLLYNEYKIPHTEL